MTMGDKAHGEKQKDEETLDQSTKNGAGERRPP